MKIYISGPITDNDQKQVKKSFAAIDYFIKKQGHTPVNPLLVDPPENLEDKEEVWQYYMRKAICLLMECDAIYMHPSWSTSKGASLERALALSLKFPIFYTFEDLYIHTEGKIPQRR